MSDGIEYGGDGCPCERCGRPRGPRGCALLDSQGCLLTALLAARALAGSRYERLQDLETEVAAWRALAEWLVAEGSWTDIEWPVDMSEGEEPSRFSCRATWPNNIIYGTGPTQQAAVVSLARQLKLIPEAK